MASGENLVSQTLEGEEKTSLWKENSDKVITLVLKAIKTKRSP